MKTSFLNQSETDSVVLEGRQMAYKITTSFWISEQKEFIDSLTLRYNVSDIRRKEGGAEIYLRCSRKQSETIVDDIYELFSTKYVEHIV